MTNDSSAPGPQPGPVPGAGPTPPPPAGQAPGQAMSSFFAAIRRLGVHRSQERWVGGVAGGLADRTGIDPLLVRGVVGVTMLMGFGLVLYGIAWALLPEQSDGRIHLEEALRGNFDVALLGAIGMVVVGTTSGDLWVGWGPFHSGWFSALAWIAAVVAVVLLVRNARAGRRDGSAPPWQAPSPRPPFEGQTPMSYPAPPAGGPTPTGPSATAPAGHPPYGPAPAAAPTYAAGAPPYGTPPRAPVPPAGGGRGWVPPQPPPPPAPRPPRPPRPRPSGPGRATTGAVVAVILLGLAALLAAERTGAYTGPVTAVVVGGGILLTGVAIIISGLRGRTAGGLTALAIIGFVIAGPATAFQDGRWWHADARPFGDSDVTVTTRDDARGGYSFGLGNATIDLTDVPLTDETLRVPISGGLGDVTVLVPEGVPVVADVQSGGGNVTWRVGDDEEFASGVGHGRTFRSEEVEAGRRAQIALDVEVGLGNVTIEES